MATSFVRREIRPLPIRKSLARVASGLIRARVMLHEISYDRRARESCVAM